MANSLYDEDGIDGPFERAMARPPSSARSQSLRRGLVSPTTADLLATAKAVLHQLVRGEAAGGDARDIAWCARTLRTAIRKAERHGEKFCGRALDTCAHGREGLIEWSCDGRARVKVVPPRKEKRNGV